MMLLLYNLLSAIAALLYSPWIFFKKGPDNRTTFIKERYGLAEYEKTDIWMHAVSVGEILASLSFLKALKKNFPSKKIVLSTTTYTGQKIALDRFPEADRIMYTPVDSIFCTRRVASLLKPEIFITVETELWPALFQSLKNLDARIVILNGRISNASYQGYRKIKFFMTKLLSKVDYLYMQDDGGAERIINLGGDRDKVGIMGNFKFDMEFDHSTSLNWHYSANSDILLAASTHKGEEEIILDAFTIIKKTFAELKLVLAPRHPERFDEVAELINKKGYSYVRRSEIIQDTEIRGRGSVSADKGQQPTDNMIPDIILLDSVGELPIVFADITITFVGGSLVPIGGHNIFEPAYWSKPIIFGPHMDNFPAAADFLDSNAALEVKNSKNISDTVIDLLNNNDKALQMGKNAKKIVDKNTGAVKRAIELVRSYIGTV
jgi:3-deoxy-D-manno-octulosonic-acid transferase